MRTSSQLMRVRVHVEAVSPWRQWRVAWVAAAGLVHKLCHHAANGEHIRLAEAGDAVRILTRLRAIPLHAFVERYHARLAILWAQQSDAEISHRFDTPSQEGFNVLLGLAQVLLCGGQVLPELRELCLQLCVLGLLCLKGWCCPHCRGSGSRGELASDALGIAEVERSRLGAELVDCNRTLPGRGCEDGFAIHFDCGECVAPTVGLLVDGHLRQWRTCATQHTQRKGQPATNGDGTGFLIAHGQHCVETHRADTPRLCTVATYQRREYRVPCFLQPLRQRSPPPPLRHPRPSWLRLQMPRAKRSWAGCFSRARRAFSHLQLARRSHHDGEGPDRRRSRQFGGRVPE